jgi:hydrogenase maturation protease
MDCDLAATVNLNRSILVIGYGNSLRSDDAIGAQVAQEISRWGMPNVKTIAVHQLTPELAETIANFDISIFVDAYPSSDQSKIQIERLTFSEFKPITGHSSDPQSLLALTQALYDRVPQAWWVIVPGVNFEVGDRLSFTAEHNIKTALHKINHLMQIVRTEPCMKLE